MISSRAVEISKFGDLFPKIAQRERGSGLAFKYVERKIGDCEDFVKEQFEDIRQQRCRLARQFVMAGGRAF
jgi:hypothetical protein